MKQAITISVPGKLMLLGEHAVVYGSPCIVIAINKRMQVTTNLTDEAIFNLTAEDIGFSNYQKPMQEIGKDNIPKEAQFTELAVATFRDKYKTNSGISITTKSDFPPTFGFGSSSAVVVGVLKSLAELFGVKLFEKELFDLSYKVVLDIQGKGSGFDLASAIYGGTIYYKTGGSIIESLKTNEINLVIGYSGVKADTVSMINLTEEKMKNYQNGVRQIFNNIANIVEEAKGAILEKDWERAGTLMDYNQSYLEDLGVSTDKLNQMITAAKKAGAYGAKLSGAGGGDCMIALVSPERKKDIEEAIKNTGGEIIDAKIDNIGVRVEM